MPTTDADVQKFIAEAVELLAQSRHALATLVEKYAALIPSEASSASPIPDDVRRAVQQADALNRHTALLQAQLRGEISNVPQDAPASGVQLLQWQEEERAKTAKRLEDTDGQLLANAIFELAAVKNLIMDNSDMDVVMAGIDALQQELEDGLANLRFLVADLEPGTVLGNFGLVAGLRRYLAKFQERVGLPTQLEVRTLVEPLPYIIETAIFRVLQEILHNIAEHADASSVTVTVEENDGKLQFTVTDDGIGIAENLSNHPRRQLGLVSITEIARLLHGSIQIKSAKNAGTAVILSLPYPKF